MPIRDMVEIDEGLCDGCGDCVTACAEGAIAIVDGKARLVSDIYCDGLGACLGHCPQGAITVVRREADGFDEEAVARHLEKTRPSPAAGPSPVPAFPVHTQFPVGGGCPGSRPQMLSPEPEASPAPAGVGSQLRHWPIQLHLVPPTAGFFQKADVLLAADCVPFAVSDFHGRFLSGRALAIACPKLDANQEIYLQKLVSMIDEAEISSLTVVVMEVPCCGGLVRLAEESLRRAQRTVPVECVVVGTGGQVLQSFEVGG